MPSSSQSAKRSRWPGTASLLVAGATISLTLAVVVIIQGLPEAASMGNRKAFQLPTLLIWIGLTCGGLAAGRWKQQRQREQSVPEEHRWADEEAWLDAQEFDRRYPVALWIRWRWPSVGDPHCPVEEWNRLTRKHPESLRLSEGLIVSLLAERRWEEAQAEIIRIQGLGLREGTRVSLWMQWLASSLDTAGENLGDGTVAETLRHLSLRGQVQVLDLAACRCFMRPVGSQWLGLADRLSERALALAPQSATVRGTRGAVLAELGRDVEAEQLLRPLFDSSSPGVNRSYSALYLAIVAARRGDGAAAAEFAKAVRGGEVPDDIRDRLLAAGL